jgi:hypothetical protein
MMMRFNPISAPSSTSSTPAGSGPRSQRWILAAALLALLLKIYCAATTVGETDVRLFFLYGENIHHHGLGYVYRATVLFNHTPLVGNFSQVAYELSAWLNPPDSPRAFRFFPLILRLPAILADFLAVLVLLRASKKISPPPPGWALALFSLSPVSFMVSGYHGNVDSVMVLCLIVAAYFCVREHAPACGLFFGLACNVKIIPLLFVPVFLFFWLHRGRKPLLQFAAAGVLVCLIGWSPALAGSPAHFFRQVIGYSSYWGSWGVCHWLNNTPWKVFHSPGFFVLNPVQQGVVTCLKLLIIGAVARLAWIRRKEGGGEIFTTLALGWIVFFVFSPAVCAQYLVWLAPFVLVYSAGWYGALTAAGSLYLFVFYNTISHGMPWLFGDSTQETAAITEPWSNWPWAVTIACLVGSRKKIRPESAGHGKSPKAEP